MFTLHNFIEELIESVSKLNIQESYYKTLEDVLHFFESLYSITISFRWNEEKNVYEIPLEIQNQDTQEVFNYVNNYNEIKLQLIDMYKNLFILNIPTILGEDLGRFRTEYRKTIKAVFKKKKVPKPEDPQSEYVPFLENKSLQVALKTILYDFFKNYSETVVVLNSVGRKTEVIVYIKKDDDSYKPINRFINSGELKQKDCDHIYKTIFNMVNLNKKNSDSIGTIVIKIHKTANASGELTELSFNSEGNKNNDIYYIKNLFKGMGIEI